MIDIPELLESIIHFLDTSDCVAAACVAHTWTSPALDRIWRSLPKMYNVLSLLGQLDAGDFDDYLVSLLTIDAALPQPDILYCF